MPDGYAACSIAGHLFEVKADGHTFAPMIIVCEICGRKWWVGGEMDETKFKGKREKQEGVENT